MQDQFMSEIHALLQKYNEALEPKGIQCSVSKKYFETEVNPRSYNHAGGIFNLLDDAWDTHREKKYKHQPNRYHSLIFTVSPTDKLTFKSSQCKQFVFLLKKAERVHTGEAPEKKLYKQEKIINKIEKRLQGILKKLIRSLPTRSAKNRGQICFVTCLAENTDTRRPSSERIGLLGI